MNLVEAARKKLNGKTIFFRIAWILFAGVTVILFAAVLPTFSRLVNESCSINCSLLSIPLSIQTVNALATLGIGNHAYAGYLQLLSVSHAVVAISLSSLVVWRKGDDWRVLLTAGAGIASLPLLSPVFFAIALSHDSWHMPFSLMRGVSFVVASYALFLFPNGCFQPHWTRWLAHTFALAIGLWLLFPNLPLNPVYYRTVAALFPETIIAIAIIILVATTVLLNRYRLMSDQKQRQQIKWVVWGTLLAVLVLLLPFVPLLTYFGLDLNLLAVWFALHPEVVAIMLYPIAVTGAILSHRLWDIDRLINRTLVYGVLSLGIVAVYALVVGGLGSLFHAQGNLFFTLLATGLIALLFQPAREWLQKTVNRLMFGERDDPYAVLSKLGRQLGETAVPNQTLPAIAATICQTLKLPYAAIELVANEERQPAASSGERGTAVLQEWPLRYQGEIVGWLQAAPRSPGEPFTAKERQLLGDIAAQAGAAAYSLRLTNVLQKSREKLTLTREEERRRIRRDLHDELGPTLASQTFTIDAILELLESDPSEAARLLRGLKAQNQATVSEIRRLVYELRPPALDELGLVGALQAHAAQLHNPQSLQIQITAWPDPLPPLSAAVEVAAYRIALEALTNAARHAGAQSCNIRLQAEDSRLTLTVADDGRGLEPNGRHGVGLHSMRERAEELGGKLTVESGNGTGVKVTASIPLFSQSEADGA